jgi:hypothetical protein
MSGRPTPTVEDGFGKIVGLVPTVRLLLIATYRPDFEPPWVGLPHVTTLILNRLGERDIGGMIDRITGYSYGYAPGYSVSGALSPSCSVRSDAEDVTRLDWIGSHIWLTI